METSQEFTATVELPSFPGASQVTRRNTSADPDVATAQTIEAMQRAAREDSSSYPVQLATKEALLFCEPGAEAIAAAVFDWLKRNIRFQGDDEILARVFGLDNELDLLIRPARLVTMTDPAEDCDGFTMLACAMLLAAGVPCEMVTLKADRSEPGRFSHVYCRAVLAGGGRVPLDCSHGPYPGWEACDYFERKTWGIMYPQIQPARASGLHGYGLSSVDWGAILGDVTKGGLEIAKMHSMPVGYMQTPTMTANYGSGATPAFPLSLSGGGLNTSTLLLIGAGLVGLMFVSSAFRGR